MAERYFLPVNKLSTFLCLNRSKNQKNEKIQNIIIVFIILFIFYSCMSFYKHSISFRNNIYDSIITQVFVFGYILFIIIIYYRSKNTYIIYNKIIKLLIKMDKNILKINNRINTKYILRPQYSNYDFLKFFGFYFVYYTFTYINDLIDRDFINDSFDVTFVFIQFHLVLFITSLLMFYSALYKKRKFINNLLQKVKEKQNISKNIFSVVVSLWNDCDHIHKLIVNAHGPILLVRLWGIYISLVGNGYFTIEGTVKTTSAVFFCLGTFWTLWIITYHIEKNIDEVKH